jgi:quinol monooxygenase YgiN
VITSRLHVIAHIRARPEHVKIVRDVLIGYVEPTRAEDGCLAYELFEDRSDEAHFTFVEEWSSEAALELHGQSPHIKAGRERLSGLTSAPTQVIKYSRVA